ncbi:hypothetical protein BC829DRAFT_161955 [Chytridium lagenaria]|nr:hypothetical protein BC829DRAFT_161955 [Chytridium lagenaria]
MDVCKTAPNGVITTAYLEAYLSKNNLRSKSGRISMSSTSADFDGDDDMENDDEFESRLLRQDSGSSSQSLQFGADSGSHSRHQFKLPINEPLIFELSKNVVLGNQFDMILQCVEDFRAAEPRAWFGRLWANLTSVRPLTTSTMYSSPMSGLAQTFDGGLEHLLRIIFTKFANKEFSEGLFLLRAEFGADWFTPILQHPYCILRHTNPPVAARNSQPPAKRQKRASTAIERGPLAPPFESYVMFYLGPNIKDFLPRFSVYWPSSRDKQLVGCDEC